jgi:hypothetical protein
MLRLDDLSKPIFKPILDPDESSYTLSLEIHDDPRNPLRHPKHRSHQGHKEDQEKQQQWLEDIKNLCTFAIEGMDESLDKTSTKDTNLREILDIHEESTLEFEKEDDINEHGSYFMSTS